MLPILSVFNATNKVAASKLTASHTEGDNHFYVREIKDVENHVDSTTVCSTVSNYLQLMVTGRLMEKTPRSLIVFIKECVCQIVKRQSRLRYHNIQNETGVRYVFGDSIAEMLVDGLNYSMQFEECVETSESAVRWILSLFFTLCLEQYILGNLVYDTLLGGSWFM